MSVGSQGSGSDRPFGVHVRQMRQYSNDAPRNCLPESIRKVVGPHLDLMLQSREMTEKYLGHSDPNMRRAALILLIEHWKPTPSLAALAKAMVTSETEDSVREVAVRAIGACYRRTQNLRISKTLADIVRDQTASVTVRQSAYFALFRVQGVFSLDWPNPLTFRFPDEVDWSFVDKFALDFNEEGHSLMQGKSRTTSPFNTPTEVQLGADAYMAGMAAFEKGDFQDAIEHFTASINHVPQSHLNYLMRGCSSGNLGSLDDAIADFGKAIQLRSDDAAAYYERSEAYRRKTMLNEANDDYRRAISLDPRIDQKSG